MWLGYGVTGGWLHAKVALVALLIAFHVYLGKLLRRLRARPQPPRPRVLPLAERDSRAADARGRRLARRREAVLKRQPRRVHARMADDFFAPCPRGLEAPLAAELARSARPTSRPPKAASAFAGRLDARVSRKPRVAAREPRSCGASAAAPYRGRAGALRARARASTGRATSRPSARCASTSPRRARRCTSLEFATLRIKDAVCDRIPRRIAACARRSTSARRTCACTCYLTEREATIYLDTSGEPLFKRGYRRETDEAPLRENLAAGLLRAGRWTPGTPLLDPMCGSGTIAIEAALIAADRAPGLARTFGFQKLAWYDGPDMAAHQAGGARPRRAAPAAPSIVRERHRRAAPSARRSSNLRAAQVDAFVARRAAPTC